MHVPPYHIRIGLVNEIVLEGFGEVSEHRAAKVIDPTASLRAVVLEPVSRSRGAPGWDEDTWRQAVQEVLGLIFRHQPIQACWDRPAPEPAQVESWPPSVTDHLGASPV